MPVSELIGALASGAVEIIDLTQPLSESTPVIALPGYLLTVADIEAWESEHGRMPEHAWVLLRTGWGSRAQDETAFLNVQDGAPQTPGPDVEASRWLEDLCGYPHKSPYAESRVMPRSRPDQPASGQEALETSA